MSEWQPIETAPKDGTSVLLHWSEDQGFNGAIVLAFWSDIQAEDTAGDGWALYTGNGYGALEAEDPTHWHALPEPPE